MKFLKTALCAMLLIGSLASCKKENDDNISPGIVGRWEGTFHEDGENYFLRLDVNADGTVDEYSEAGVKVGSGNWTLDAQTKIFQAYVEWSGDEAYSYMGAFDDKKHKMAGNWGFDYSSTDGGTFKLSKKN